jgi:transposase
MRRSFDGLCGMAQELMKQDPLSGHLFLFRNRNRDRLKILYWNNDGLVIWYKRLEQGTWQFPSDVKENNTVKRDDDVSVVEITREELSLLLDGIDLRSVSRRRRFAKSKKAAEVVNSEK